jgi:glycolate oxidase iron-sulfur subunit
MAELVNIAKHEGGSDALPQEPLCAKSNFSGADKPTWDLYSTCIHCGLCLNHCPTYRTLGVEMDSPRGRIYQVLQVDEGRLPIDDSFVTHIDRCLGCLACETACPSGVQYGRIVERARAQIETHYQRSPLQRLVRWAFYQKILKDFHRLAQAARAMRYYQTSGLQRFVRQSGMLKLLGMEEMEQLAPQIEPDFFFDEFGMLIPAVGEKRARVGFHAGCIANVAFSSLNYATVRLLSLNGVEVYVTPRQRCCGALHSHAGYRDDARKQARKNIDTFMDGSQHYDAVVTNAAGCGSTLKEYDDLLGDDPEYKQRAREFSEKVMDVTEFLAKIGLRPPPQKCTENLTYQDPCHLAHAQKVRTAPRELLTAVGATIVELPHWDQCCGSAGTYNVTQNDLSMKILDAKMEDVRTVAGDVSMVVTANVGCMIQLRAGMEKNGLNLPVKHVIEVLNDCYY